MSVQIDTALVKEYGDTVVHLAQQGYQKMSQHCLQGTMNAEGRFFERVGAVDMYEITDRHGETRYVETPHSRRYVTPGQYAVADLVDNADELQARIDPSNEYTKAQAASMARKKDAVFYAAAIGNAATGKAGTGTPATITPYGTGAMTMSRINTARRTFQENEVDLDMEAPHWAVHPHFMEDLLNEVTDGTVGHADHYTTRQLQSGEITQGWGFNWHILSSNKFDSPSSDLYTTVTWIPSGMAFAFNEQSFSSMDQLPQKNYSWQVYCRFMGGAVRLEEEKVQGINVDASA